MLDQHQSFLHGLLWRITSLACIARLITSKTSVGDIAINMLQHSQTKLPMPTANDGTSNVMECARELCVFLFINNFEYIPQLDETLNHDTGLP